MAKLVRPKAPRTTTRHAPEVRRTLVLEAAARLIADEGLLAATMRRIADAAGISLGTLTHHFASVDDLLAQALEFASIRFTDALIGKGAKGSGLLRLHALCRAVVPDDVEAVRQWRLWIQFWSRAVYDPELTRTHDRRYRAWHATVEELIEAGIEDGSLRTDLKKKNVTENLVAVVDGVCFQVALKGGGMTSAQGLRIIKRAIDELRAPA